MKKYLIFDLDGTLVESMKDTTQLVVNVLTQNSDVDEEKAWYIFNTTPWMALKSQLEIIMDWASEIDIERMKTKIYAQILTLEWHFFEWVPERIKQLSKTYTLFLTTGNSTPVAKKYLEWWWISNCFDLIYWSDQVLKWMDHLNIFKQYSQDEDFFKNSVYLWDGAQDRIYAAEAGIDFIHIWNEGKDTYEIESVVDIDNILEKLNS